MIPRLLQNDTLDAVYLAFIEALQQTDFSGDLNSDYANRIVLSTDNSIYQVLPQAVLYPKSTEDLVRIAMLASKDKFSSIHIAARGGGTGTNGQSLCDGLIVDLSKYMNNIIELNLREGWVRVQPGVVKDQLNAALKPYGLFFAPELSTSNRATIGGMINTDASGQGSCMYGKTRDHVLELQSVFRGGIIWKSKSIDDNELAKIKRRNDIIGRIHQLVDDVFNDNETLIDSCFPKLNRCLTGYDLAHIRDEQGNFNLNSLLCGAEGSLAFISEAKLNVLPIPKHAALVNIKYSSFEASLRDATELMKWRPASIETIDSKVLNLAMEDIVWNQVSQYFPQNENEPEIRGINLVEYTGDDEQQLKAQISELTAHLDSIAGHQGKSTGYSVVYGATEIAKVWGMRKKAVGLLGNAQGESRPIPFVEDTAVPPENLADFILDFRKVLDDNGLSYGMFGHVDAGVLHVRPAIDMKDPEQEKMIRQVTDKVVALTMQYKGLLWGEHGKGVRSEYAPEFFGELYPALQKIKAIFDPSNQMNPGKIATPLDSGAELLKIDEVPTRGQFDRQIKNNVRQYFSSAMFCNGNGACFNYDPNDAMCPSWKGTRQRIHSPKGRASLIREWLRLMEYQNIDLVNESEQLRQHSILTALPKRIKNSLKKEDDFSHQVHEVMRGCLACKSCVGQCPIKVNVPDFRARFFELYYGRYLRPLRDHVVSRLELMLPLLSHFPNLYNFIANNKVSRKLMEKYIGMVDSPMLCRTRLLKGIKRLGIPLATTENIAKLDKNQTELAVMVVQDAFTSYFEADLVLDLLELLSMLGFYVMLVPFKPNGKPQHVHGFMANFEKTAKANIGMLNELAATNIPLIGIDPPMTLTYRQEYKDVIPAGNLPDIHLFQEWLAEHINIVPDKLKKPKTPRKIMLLPHCSEKTSAVASIHQWQKIYSTLGHELDVRAVGCCGMAGTYGHETENSAMSKHIYSLSWADIINAPENKGRIVVTGYSCRSQVTRIDRKKLPHPGQMLLEQLQILTEQ